MTRGLYLGSRVLPMVGILLLLQGAKARADFLERSVFFGAGFMGTNTFRVSTTDTASRGLVSEVLPTFVVGSNIWNFQLRLGGTPIGHSVNDNAATKRLFFFDVNYAYSLSPYISFHGGPGLLFQNLSGNGGSVVLPNGTGTSTFGLPDESRTIKLLYLNLGMGFWITPEIEIMAEGVVTDTFSSRRAVNLLATVVFGIK